MQFVAVSSGFDAGHMACKTGQAMFRKLLLAAVAVLVGFHVWLFASQAWAGELADFGLLIRWGISGGLIWALAELHRQGESVVWGRKAVAVWLLAASLHGPAVAERVGAADLRSVQDVAVTVVQISIAGVVLGALLLLAALAAVRRRPALRVARADTRPVVSALLLSGSSLLVAPRPPPLA